MNGGRAALALLARGLAGVDVEVLPLEGGAGPRAVLAGRRLLLPAGAGDARLRRAMVAHAVAHLRHSVPARPARALRPMGIAVVSAIEDARVERLLCRDFPGLQGGFAQALPPAPDPLDLGFAAFVSRLDRVLLLPGAQDGNHWVDKARRLFEQTAARAGLEDYDAFRAIASILANDLGQMRVRFDPQHYTVPAPWRDDNSWLWDFGEAEVPPDEAIALRQSGARPMPPPGSDAPADGASAPPEGVADMELGRYSYPEWDRRLERLRPDWCTVIEKLPAWQGQAAASAPGGAGNERIAPLALPRAHRLDRTHRLRRQWEGDEIDLDAAIEVRLDRRLRLRPDPRLFMRPGRGPRPSSVLVLLDLSASTNDTGSNGAGGAGASLLDIEKQAALLLAASNARGTDRLAIHGFSSNTRAGVYYYRLLEFGQPLAAPSRAMIGAVRGRWSTRLGAALRHAAAQLRAEPAGQRAILLVTDGAPSDIDVHDPKYLVEDARMAVAEARVAGVRTACIAVDGQAGAYVRRIFGWRDYCIAEDARSLPARLARMSARLAAAR